MALILVVEDEADIRDDIEDILRYGGHQTVSAGNGKEGLEVALKAHPDLILSDINMPVMDGGKFLESVRAQPAEVANTPFVFLSAYAEREAVIEGKRIGADDYVTKPIDHDLLLETVNARLRQVRRLGEQKKQELETLRRQVLDTFPHELRTPLNSIIGFSELLVSDADTLKLSSNAREYAGHVLESGRRLQDLCEKVLDLVAVTTGRLIPQERELELAGVVDAALSIHQGSAARKSIRIAVQIAPTVARVRSDETFLRRAVLELLSNAIKFTDKGGSVTLTAELGADGAPTITVADTGAGISDEAARSVGTPFFQETSGYTRRHEGLGIGLSVARAFVETMGGRIEMHSTVRVGTTARIVLGPEARVTPVAENSGAEPKVA